MTDENTIKLKGLLLAYSTEDLLKSFFTLNLWLPNIASPIKIQYLYVALESIQKGLPIENKIKSYVDFEAFCKSLFAVLPSFTMLEDYVPETDWAEIKYYFEKHFFKIFYGGDLSNPYDFYYAFEITHHPFEQHYLDIIKRSPVTEMRFCLGLQNHILSNLKQEKSSTLEDVTPGHLELPSEAFWNSAVNFLDTYKPTDFSPDMLDLYIKDLEGVTEFPDINTFVENAYRGRNCCYFFIRKDGKIYPVMPRKWLTVIYDKWGRLLQDNFIEIGKRMGDARPDVLIGIRIGHFISDRIDEDCVFTFSAPIKSNLKPPHELIYTAVHADDRLYLIYTTPPVFNRNDLSKHLEEIAPKLRESADLVKTAPTRLAQFSENRVAEFRSEKAETLKPVFIIALPSVISDTEGSIKIPDGIEAEIMTIDQLTGIFDEIEKAKELNDFIDYLEDERAKSRIPGLNSYLDRFGSFRDSHGVLVPGALEPNMIMLDFGWGSNYRFKSLKKFWASYPTENLFGHPRSWTIPEDRKTATGIILNSKNFFGYAYVQHVGEAIFHINAPVHRMDLEEGKTADTLMQMLFDTIDIYQDILKRLDITKSQNKAHFFFCSSATATSTPELSHLKHLVQNEQLWLMDSARIRARDFSVRTVYSKEKVFEALKDVKDRSFQIALLIEALRKLAEVCPEPALDGVITELEKEKGKRPRFGMFAIEKRASFPQHVANILPEERECKLADKEIAGVAHELGIEPGTYSAEDAKLNLNQLRNKIVEILDSKIKLYGFSECLPLLFAKSNALINEAWQTEAELKATIEHDVDYDASERSSEREKKFLHWYRVYRYLIEKFVQHEPSGSEKLDEQKLKELLALSDRLMDIYVSSDFINYELYPVSVEIDRDYIVSTRDEQHDIASMEKEYGEEQARINLGLIGNKKDTADSSLPIGQYLSEIDAAFKKDFGFGLKNLINVQQIFAMWADRIGVPEATSYSATIEEIADASAKEIIGYDKSETPAILDFLTLKQEKMLFVKGESVTPPDLPVWEHNKRLMRFDMRPLIKHQDKYYWAPHSIERTSRIWMGISGKHRLPSDIEAPTVKSALLKGHQDLENNLVVKTKEIVSRFTSDIKTEVYPHIYDSSIADIGDYDVIAYLKDKNVLLNIESKIIDPPHSNKDSGRMQRKIYGEKRTDGSFKKGYLQRVEERTSYLTANSQQLMTNLGWAPPSTPPKVVSIFVTKMGFWWTKFPPLIAEVKFVEIRLLDDFIKNI